MLDFNQDKGNCTGCSACYSACPIHCISMKADEEGFLYPEANDSCIHCGLCERVCPAIQKKKDFSFGQKAIAAVAKDYNIWHRSASGGAFSEICRHFADEHTLIVGAAWDGLRVHHIGVMGFNTIAPLCKSKYVGSAIEDTFIDIRSNLKSGNKAVFCGCPCQVAGLKAFLGKDFDNLLTIDLICHGNGSPKVFIKCMDVISEQLGEIVKSYQFRAKRKRYEEDHICLVTTNKSNHYIKSDPYMQLFLSQNALRPSCGKNCIYRDSHRPGDLTIADLKGLSKIFPDLVYPKRNWSTVVCNTPKGEIVFRALPQTMDVRPITIEDVVKYNPLFARQTWFSKDRDSFFEDFCEDPSEAIKKWTKPYQLYNVGVIKTIFLYLPSIFKRYLRSCINYCKTTEQL